MEDKPQSTAPESLPAQLARLGGQAAGWLRDRWHFVVLYAWVAVVVLVYLIGSIALESHLLIPAGVDAMWLRPPLAGLVFPVSIACPLWGSMTRGALAQRFLIAFSVAATGAIALVGFGLILPMTVIAFAYGWCLGMVLRRYGGIELDQAELRTDEKQKKFAFTLRELFVLTTVATCFLGLLRTLSLWRGRGGEVFFLSPEINNLQAIFSLLVAPATWIGVLLPLFVAAFPCRGVVPSWRRLTYGLLLSTLIHAILTGVFRLAALPPFDLRALYYWLLMNFFHLGVSIGALASITLLARWMRGAGYQLIRVAPDKPSVSTDLTQD
ncbi:hypothetical protein [Botrimarina hoheduenensis]|uniref:Uncharacterized protein n=1 Tax=Botrimarina hoheduenensis TaxID=2528000 RepID=A0A5C5VXL8_9BACT|nr:hypothetical protein [Botrimarina hoheduenensis]TWT43388.1 hypothetical protein Pla111_23390 [Botrimarina hoheduenensis]